MSIKNHQGRVRSFAASVGAAAAVVLALAPAAGHAALVGQWTFEGANPLADSTGNFDDLTLRGATIDNGALVVTGNGTTASGWANATGGDFSSSPITDKTLVSWVTVTDTSAWSGSAMTIDKSNSDQFDAIVFGERQTNTWMNGSSYFARTQDAFSGPETAVGTQIMMAITYDVSGGQVSITGYRNGVSLGSYVSGNAASWGDSFTEIIFGARHSGDSTQSIGALNARIDEARLYDTALTQSEVAALSMAPVPEPETYAMLLAGLGVIGAVARRRRHTAA